MKYKIERSLIKLARANPDEKFRVVIVHANGVDFSSFKSGNFERLMENVSSAQISGKDIIRLSQKKGVESIEADLEMKIL